MSDELLLVWFAAGVAIGFLLGYRDGFKEARKAAERSLYEILMEGKEK